MDTCTVSPSFSAGAAAAAAADFLAIATVAVVEDTEYVLFCWVV
jgi:hypothetical protein